MSTSFESAREVADEDQFIIQNTLPGPLSLTDIGIDFARFQARDLAWERGKDVKRSEHLRTALKKGYVRQITQAQWDQILEQEAIWEQMEAEKAQRERDALSQDVDLGDKTIKAEAVNINSGNARGSRTDEVSMAGWVNDPSTYGKAFANASRAAAARGEILDARSFAQEMVDLQNGRAQGVPSAYQQSVYSGNPERGRATYSTGVDGAGVQTVRMANHNRDHYIPGAGEGTMFLGTPQDLAAAYAGGSEPPVAEAIDLGADTPKRKAGRAPQGVARK